MASITSVCVYCGASDGHAERHRAAARALGRVIAGQGWRMVYGGGRVGLMGLCADACIAAGGRVLGIIPEHLAEAEVAHPGLDRLLVVDSMHTRKRLMADRSDAFLVLPGGLGTLDETFEILTWRQLGLHDKPVVLVNIDGFWDPLLALLHAQAEAGFLKPAHLRLLAAVDRVDAVVGALDHAPEPALADTGLLSRS